MQKIHLWLHDPSTHDGDTLVLAPVAIWGQIIELYIVTRGGTTAGLFRKMISCCSRLCVARAQASWAVEKRQNNVEKRQSNSKRRHIGVTVSCCTALSSYVYISMGLH